jgi:putative PIN family toxin of toxin-antitoxin system
LFPTGRLSWLPDRWAAGEIRPLVSRTTADELIRVLAYPKFALTRDEIDAVLGAYLPFTESVTKRGSKKTPLPECDDPADQEFLRLALEGAAQALVTGDDDLLRLRGRTPFDIVTPAELRDRLR